MDPKNPEEPQRTSRPNTPQPEVPAPMEVPSPMQAPGSPNTEYEREVPHEGNEPIARTGQGGEGSYEGTQRYDNGIDQFSKQHSLEESIADAKKIDVDDPALKQAEKLGRSQPKMAPEQGRKSAPSVH